MTIGTPTQVGSGTNTSSPLTITTSVDAPATDMVLAIIAGNTGTVSSVSDSASNSYTTGTALLTPGSKPVCPFYAPNAADLPLGGTATATLSVPTPSAIGVVISISGLLSSSPLDIQGAGSSSTGTTPSIATGVLAHASECVIGFVLISAGSSDTFTEAAGFTTGGSIAGVGNILRWAYQIVSSTSSVTYAPTLGTSRAYAANVMSFVGGVSVAISQVLGAGSLGLAKAAIASTVSQLLATGSRGSISAGISRTAAQALATGSEGSLKAALAVAPAQLGATASKGSPSPGITRAATQVSAAGVRGSLIADITGHLAQHQATVSEGSLKAKLMVSVSGEVAAVTPGQAVVPPTPGVMSAMVFAQRIAIRATLG